MLNLDVLLFQVPFTNFIHWNGIHADAQLKTSWEGDISCLYTSCSWQHNLRHPTWMYRVHVSRVHLLSFLQALVMSKTWRPVPSLFSTGSCHEQNMKASTFNLQLLICKWLHVSCLLHCNWVWYADHPWGFTIWVENVRDMVALSAQSGIFFEAFLWSHLGMWDTSEGWCSSIFFCNLFGFSFGKIF